MVGKGKIGHAHRSISFSRCLEERPEKWLVKRLVKLVHLRGHYAFGVVVMATGTLHARRSSHAREKREKRRKEGKKEKERKRGRVSKMERESERKRG